MKKTVLTFLALLLSAGVFSQQHKHETYISGGLGGSTLFYDLNVGNTNFALGGAVGVGHRFFFSEHVGLGLGVEVARYNGGYHVKNLKYHEDFVDPDFGPVKFRATFNEYRERQSATVVNVPIMMHFQTVGEQRFYVGVGGKLSIPYSFRFKQDPIVNLQTEGYGPKHALPLGHASFLGYGTYDREGTDYRSLKEQGLAGRLNLIASLEFGAKWRLGERSNLYTSVYFDYGLFSLSRLSSKSQTKDFFPYYSVSAVGGKGKGEDVDVTVNSVLNARYNYDNESADLRVTKNDRISPAICGFKLTLAFGSGDVFGQTKKEKKAKVIEEIVEVEKIEKIEEVEALPIRKEEVIADVAIEDERLRVLTDEERDLRPKLGYAQEDARIALVVDNYYLNGAELTPYWKHAIDNVILPLKDRENIYLILEGHTCDLGSNAVNDRLSLQRANVVRGYLVSKGFSAKRIQTVGLGKNLHIVPNTNKENRKVNRRVVFVIYDNGK